MSCNNSRERGIQEAEASQLYNFTVEQPYTKKRVRYTVEWSRQQTDTNTTSIDDHAANVLHTQPVSYVQRTESTRRHFTTLT